MTERPGVVADRGLRRESGKPLEDGTPVFVVEQPIARDCEGVGGPDFDVIKPLTSDPGLGTNRGHKGTFAARLHQHDIEAGVSFLVRGIGKKQRNTLSLQCPTG